MLCKDLGNETRGLKVENSKILIIFTLQKPKYKFVPPELEQLKV